MYTDIIVCIISRCIRIPTFVYTYIKVAEASAVLTPVVIKLPVAEPPPSDDAMDALPSGRVGVVGVAGGGSFTVAVSERGNAYEWGLLPWDQSRGAQASVTSVGVRAVAGLPAGKVVEVAAGRAHAVARTVDGQVWAWGSDDAGQLGRGGGGGGQAEAVLVVAEGAVAVAAGGDVSACCLGNGSLLVWGGGTWGTRGPRPTQDTAGAAAAGRRDGDAVRVVGELRGVRVVQAAVGGDGRVLVRDGAGAVWAWGPNERGQCGFDRARVHKAGHRPGKTLEWGDKIKGIKGALVPSEARVGGSMAATGERGGRRAAAGPPGPRRGKGIEGGPAAVIASPVQVRGLPRPVTAIAAGLHHALAITRDVPA